MSPEKCECIQRLLLFYFYLLFWHGSLVSPGLAQVSPVLKPTNASAKEKGNGKRFPFPLLRRGVCGFNTGETWASPCQSIKTAFQPGAFHFFEKVYESFSRTNGFFGFRWIFVEKVYEMIGSEMPLAFLGAVGNDNKSQPCPRAFCHIGTGPGDETELIKMKC